MPPVLPAGPVQSEGAERGTMKTKIFHSANAGLYFWDGDMGLMVDGLYRGRAVGFSDLPPAMEQAAESGTGCFAHLDGLLFTHLHPDHFDGDLTRMVWERDRLPICAPGLDSPAGMLRPICSGASRLRIGHAYILSRTSIHDGPRFRDVPHRSYLLHTQGEDFFLAGDAVLGPADADFFRYYHGGAVTAVFIGLYQAVSASGQAFLRRLAPQRVFLCHLPLPKDDRNHFWKLAQQAARSFPKDLPPLTILEQMAWVDRNAAERPAPAGVMYG